MQLAPSPGGPGLQSISQSIGNYVPSPSNRFDIPVGCPELLIFRVCAGRRYKSILWSNIWPKNENFQSNLISKIDAAGRDLFVAAGKLSKTPKFIDFH